MPYFDIKLTSSAHWARAYLDYNQYWREKSVYDYYSTCTHVTVKLWLQQTHEEKPIWQSCSSKMFWKISCVFFSTLKTHPCIKTKHVDYTQRTGYIQDLQVEHDDIHVHNVHDANLRHTHNCTGCENKPSFGKTMCASTLFILTCTETYICNS